MNTLSTTQLFRAPGLTGAALNPLYRVCATLGIDPGDLVTEWVFHVLYDESTVLLTHRNWTTLYELLLDPTGHARFGTISSCADAYCVEYGPRPLFTSAWSSTALSIIEAAGVSGIHNIVRSLRIGTRKDAVADQLDAIVSLLHDRMTEMPYINGIDVFPSGATPTQFSYISLAGDDWMSELRVYSRERGLGFDDQDLVFIGWLFREGLERSPTDVELQQLAQMNSEHSRHHFFRALLSIDGTAQSRSLMEMIQSPLQVLEAVGNTTSVIAFNDDASAVRGGEVTLIMPPHQKAGPWRRRRTLVHLTGTAETHNHPAGVSPFPGAATGTGGRLRDNGAVGRGGLTRIGLNGYCVPGLRIPDYRLPWEGTGYQQSSALADMPGLLTEMFRGAHDYGNCFGEPVVGGFCRSGELVLLDGARGWFKPLMFTAGIGLVRADCAKPQSINPGYLILQIGGPAYQIGIGGGAASSMTHGENTAGLDFASVQRGDPAMENQMMRVIAALAHLGDANPIVTLVDLGAGGSANALTELVEATGGTIRLDALPSGDQSLGDVELWVNEAQERMALVIRPEDLELVQVVCAREGCPCAVVGETDNTGRLELVASHRQLVDLPLHEVLSGLPRKTFNLESKPPVREHLDFPHGLTVPIMLEWVLQLLQVGSKAFLVHHVDRSVGGLTVGQQCVGPAAMPVADCAVSLAAHQDQLGVVVGIGERPNIGLLRPDAMARCALAEMLLNIVGVVVDRRSSIRYSANWMLAAKLPGEGAWLVEAMGALKHASVALQVAADGGKDSLAMAAKVQAPGGGEEVVRAPGQLVLTGYARVPDVAQRVTPDLKGGSTLCFVPLGSGEYRLGGSALAHVFGQVGHQEECPDVGCLETLGRAFDVIQTLVQDDHISAVHDISDGGLIVTLLEMAFAGNRGFNVALHTDCGIANVLFSEEPGIVIESRNPDAVIASFVAADVPCKRIGAVTEEAEPSVRVTVQGEVVLDAPMCDLRHQWGATSRAIDALTTDPACVEQEAAAMRTETREPPYRIPDHLQITKRPKGRKRPKVAIIRAPGSNGDAEMAAVFRYTGSSPHDVSMQDLVNGHSLDTYKGIAFVGGFSFADVLGAAQGWAGVIKGSKRVRTQFNTFFAREDTFSLGVCNGCQLMALLGVVPWGPNGGDAPFVFAGNHSGQFESRFSAVRINESRAVLLKGLEGATLGVWSAHGEGRVVPPTGCLLEQALGHGFVPMQYVDMNGCATGTYPWNPNGSPLGVAALCDATGRHLAMMPHPERTFRRDHWPWRPQWLDDLGVSPWIELFANARKFALGS